MVTISSIQQAIAPEIEELNRIMRDALSSNSSLLQTIVADYLQRKGKQIRPILVILSAKISGEITDKVLQAAAAIELLHNSSLIHDDVLDESQKRRGKATINSIWDNQVAVLVGDFFVSRALHCAVETGSLEVINSISNLGTILSRGEIDQIDYARHRNITEEKYFNTISQKTASLFRGCIEVGCFSTGDDRSYLENLKKYATILGLCFQIKDDIFDYFDDKTVGKPTGNDLREGKITLPLIYALYKKDAKNKEEMHKLLEKEFLSNEDIHTLIEFAKREGGIEYSYAKMNELKKEADEIIAAIPQSKATESLDAIFRYIIDREK